VELSTLGGGLILFGGSQTSLSSSSPAKMIGLRGGNDSRLSSSSLPLLFFRLWRSHAKRIVRKSRTRTSRRARRWRTMVAQAGYQLKMFAPGKTIRSPPPGCDLPP